MRRPISTNKAHAQQGFTLLIVLVVLMVIAFLVVAATQTYNTELRISSNDADRKMAMSVAEQTLRTGETRIARILDEPPGTTFTFTGNCTDGLCAPAGAVAATSGTIVVEANNATLPPWEKPWENNGVCGRDSCLVEAGTEVDVPGNGNSSLAENPRYIVEFLNTNASGSIAYFRVTARAWGRNANTVVTVQSYVEAESDY